jgi:hypothetical protein
VIALTFQNNGSRLQVAGNGFGFAGLVLDVLGTSFGVLHALKLHRSIRHIQELLRSRSKEHLADVEKEFPKIRDGVGDAAAKQWLETEISARKKFWVSRRHLCNPDVHKALYAHLEPLFRHDKPTILPLLFRLFSILGEPHAATLGTDPMIAMGGGIGCLLMSVFCFAAYSQHRSVLYACVAITVIMTSTMMSGLLIHHEGMIFA